MCSATSPERILRSARLNKNGDRMCDFGLCRKHVRLQHTPVHPDLRLCHNHCHEEWDSLTQSWDVVPKRPSPRSCHACGCRETMHLRPVYQGLFCQEHELQLTAIRMHLSDAKQEEDIQMEWQWRQEEIIFRKTQDANHMHYQYLIETRLTNKTTDPPCDSSLPKCLG